MRFVVALLGLMATVGFLAIMSAPVSAPVEPLFAAASIEPEPLRSNLDLLAEVRTVVDQDDPLYRELKEDDEFRGRNRTNWEAAVGDIPK